MLLRGDLAEDGAIERLLRRLAVGRRPQLAGDDGFKDFLAVHRVFGSGILENDDGGVEQGQPLDRLVGFVRRIDRVFVFLVLAAGLELGGLVFGDDLDGGGFFRFRFSRFLLDGLFGLLGGIRLFPGLGFSLLGSLGVGWRDGLFLFGCFPAEFDPAGRHVEFFVLAETAHAQTIFQNLDDLCMDKVLADFDADDATDFDFADVAHV